MGFRFCVSEYVGRGVLPLVFLFLVDEIYLCCANVDNFWASVPVLFKHCALETVKGIGNTRAATNDTFALDADKATRALDERKKCCIEQDQVSYPPCAPSPECRIRAKTLPYLECTVVAFITNPRLRAL